MIEPHKQIDSTKPLKGNLCNCSNICSSLNLTEPQSDEAIQLTSLKELSDTLPLANQVTDPMQIGNKDNVQEQQLTNDTISSILSAMASENYPLNLEVRLNRKKLLKKMSVVRVYHTCKRRMKTLLARNDSQWTKMQVMAIAEFIDREFSKCKISEFRLKDEREKPVERVKESTRRKPNLQIKLIEEKEPELMLINNDGEISPRTPPPNTIARDKLRKRVEETPFKKTTDEVSSYHYNSDDEIFI